MLKSYIGFATFRGLETLLPEHALAVQALTARARPGQSVCCWAVLPDSDAREIDDRLAAGETIAALALLETAARSVGQVFPGDSVG